MDVERRVVDAGWSLLILMVTSPRGGRGGRARVGGLNTLMAATQSGYACIEVVCGIVHNYIARSVFKDLEYTTRSLPI